MLSFGSGTHFTLESLHCGPIFNPLKLKFGATFPTFFCISKHIFFVTLRCRRLFFPELKNEDSISVEKSKKFPKKLKKKIISHFNRFKNNFPANFFKLFLMNYILRLKLFSTHCQISSQFSLGTRYNCSKNRARSAR